MKSVRDQKTMTLEKKGHESSGWPKNAWWYYNKCHVSPPSELFPSTRDSDFFLLRDT